MKSFVASKCRQISAWFITGSLPPHHSGAGRNDLLLASHCKKHGLDITLVAPKYAGDEETQKSGVKILRMPRAEKFLSRFFCSIKIIFLLKSNHNPDIIRMRGFGFSYAILSFILGRFYPNIRIVVQPAMFGGDDPLSIAKKRFGFFEKKQLLKADAILAMNTLMHEAFLNYKYPENRIFDVDNPVDTEKYFPVSDDKKGRLRKKLGLPEDAVIIVSLGKLCPRKNQFFITKGFKEILSNTTEKNIILVHIGPTSRDLLSLGRNDSVSETKKEEARIKVFVRDNNLAKHVLLVGNQPQPSSYLQASDIFVHASIEEGEANVINEALACGLPCVIPEIKIYSRQVPDGCTYRFFPGDYQDLCKQMLKLISNKEMRTLMGHSGRRHILSTRSATIAAKKYSLSLKRIESMAKR
jgi:glycosyltransferase involved in cell wall biosynthesis